VRYTTACEAVSPAAEERRLLEDVTKKNNTCHDWEYYWFVCDIDSWDVVTSIRILEAVDL
jgi:hypothetical protein